MVADARACIIALNNAQQVCVTVADDESAYLGICISIRLSIHRFRPLIARISLCGEAKMGFVYVIFPLKV